MAHHYGDFGITLEAAQTEATPKGWKYGLIKVSVMDEGTDTEEQINMLVELYPLGEIGEYNSFCAAHLTSLECIEQAKRDIERDGINESFFNSGKFVWQKAEFDKYEWGWTANP